MSKYYPPTYDHEQFYCPYCNVFAKQNWSIYYYNGVEITEVHGLNQSILKSAILWNSLLCVHCKNPTFWLDEKIIYPPMHSAPPANNDLPDSVKVVYDEASAIANQSPRAACALLRLAIEILLKETG